MNTTEIYNDICGFSPTLEQSEVFDALTNFDISKNPLLLRLPCGYGKTESVIIPFLSQAIDNRWSLAPRLIYVLPTRALCNQIRDRIYLYSEKVHKKTGKIITVGIEHGTSSLDPLFFSDICITTFDQFLYGYARTKQQIGRHFDLPAGSIANSIVVFDEAHLYSPYTHSLMRAMIEILVISRIPVVIMTATMPETLQNDLLNGLEITGNNHQIISFQGKWPEHKNRKITWSLKNWGLLHDGPIHEELDKILKDNNDKKVLIVVNRIDTAQKITRLLKQRKEFLNLIHSRFTIKDRNDKEASVYKHFGKEKLNQKPGIIMTTQVCEVGLDISCDILITECASADALVQRAGRVARWGGSGEIIIVRPMGLESWINDGQWDEAFPYVDQKRDLASNFNDIKEGEFAGIAWKYLEQNRDRNIFTDWNETINFCNAMNYHTDDVEARGALEQLFESTLYADERPWNLSARGELYCTLVVVSGDILTVESTAKEAVKSRKKKMQEAHVLYGELKPYFINVPFRYLVNKDTKKLRKYNFLEGRVEDELNKNRVKPFQTYLIDPSGYYDPDMGLTISVEDKVTETEEATSCLIL
jgi:CRISPR-associated endonuclease/helicase Cas3